MSLWNRQRGIDPPGQIDGQMQAAGTRIALADLLIGSTALELGFAVATANARHFGLIPKLAIKRL